MPEFIPEHTPPELDAFTQGYLECAEWLLDDEEDRDAVKGWSATAIAEAVKECEAFQSANAQLLDQYYVVSGRDDSSAGHDFWLTRNHHDYGFWERELLKGQEAGKEVLDMLTIHSHQCGETDVYVGDDGYLYFS